MPSSLMQQLLDKPSRKYNSSNVNFYSPATDPDRRRKAASDAGSYAGSDTDSIRSGFSNHSLYSVASVGRAHHSDGRRRRVSGAKYSSINGWTSSVSTLASEVIPENGSDVASLRASRAYGRSLTPGFGKQESTGLRTKSVKTIQEQTQEARRSRRPTLPAIQSWGDEPVDAESMNAVKLKRRTSVGSVSSATANSVTGRTAQYAWIAPPDKETYVPQLSGESPVKPAAKPLEIKYNNQLPETERNERPQSPGLTAANLAHLQHKTPITATLPPPKAPSQKEVDMPPAIPQSPSKSMPSYFSEANGSRSHHLSRVQEQEEETDAQTPPANLTFPHNLSRAIASSANATPLDSPELERMASRRSGASSADSAVQTSSSKIVAQAINQDTSTSKAPSATLTSLMPATRAAMPSGVFTLMSLHLQSHANGTHAIIGTVSTPRDHVEVIIRATRDNWKTQTDQVASVDRAKSSEQWSFEAPLTSETTGSLEFCVKMFGDGKIVWDSDGGNNYKVDVPLAARENETQVASDADNSTPAAIPVEAASVQTAQADESVSRKSSADTFHTSDSDLASAQVTPQPNVSAPPRIMLTRTPSNQVPMYDGLPSSSRNSPATASSATFLDNDATPPAILPAVAFAGAPAVAQAASPDLAHEVLPAGPHSTSLPANADFHRPLRPEKSATRSAPASRSRSQREPADSRSHQNSSDSAKNSPPMPRTTDTATLGQLFSPEDFAGLQQRTNSTPVSPILTPPANSGSNIKKYAPSTQSSISRGPSGRMPLPVTLSKSTSARKTLTREEWTPAALKDSKVTMCAIEIARTRTSAGVNGTTQKSSVKSKKGADHTMFGPRQFYDVVFTPKAKVNSRLKSSEVLVQVYAAGVDFYDGARVEALINRGDGLKFIPGRSFCGKIVDSGADVKLKKGDFVYGLCDLEKSGALAELLIVDKQCIALAPNDKLSIEQVAALPMTGIPALVAVRQLVHSLPKNSRVLVLNAHIGAGFIATQLLSILRGDKEIYVAAQVAPDTLEAETLCKANGVTDILRDEPVAALNRLHESSFDVVLDTIGGRRIYDASRRILHDEGYFCTLVGDEMSPPTFKTQWKASLRSLRRAFVKKDRKSISYWLPMMTEADTRAALAQLAEYAEDMNVAPVISRVWRFEDGAEAFAGGHLTGGGVIRILEA